MVQSLGLCKEPRRFMLVGSLADIDVHESAHSPKSQLVHLPDWQENSQFLIRQNNPL